MLADSRCASPRPCFEKLGQVQKLWCAAGSLSTGTGTHCASSVGPGVGEGWKQGHTFWIRVGMQAKNKWEAWR